MPYQASKTYSINSTGVCDCITTFTTENYIIVKKMKEQKWIYRKNPTKEDLIEFFGQRIGIRKMTEREALRLMDFSERSEHAIVNAQITTKLKNGIIKVKKMPKTQIYK